MLGYYIKKTHKTIKAINNKSYTVIQCASISSYGGGTIWCANHNFYFDNKRQAERFIEDRNGFKL